jgi:lipoate-protein ligase A
VFCIKSDHTNPYFNLAAEEYFLKESGREFFILYINDPSVIAGKHQNVYAEINLDYVRANNIKIARRISGGGTVWHDHGNLNFSFIRKGKDGDLVNFRKYTSPILDVLLRLGIPAQFKEKNSIVVNNLKVSGNAEHIFKNRVLHHGTLLFNSDLTSMRNALSIGQMKYHDKAVKSVRSRTANITDFLNKNMGVREFGDEILSHIMECYPDSEIYAITESELAAIRKLVQKKHITWDWIFGYSPDYTFERKIEISGQEAGIFLLVKKGLVTEVRLSGEIFQGSTGKKLESELLYQQHDENVISDLLNRSDLKNILQQSDLEKLIKSFF